MADKGQNQDNGTNQPQGPAQPNGEDNGSVQTED